MTKMNDPSTATIIPATPGFSLSSALSPGSGCTHQIHIQARRSQGSSHRCSSLWSPHTRLAGYRRKCCKRLQRYSWVRFHLTAKTQHHSSAPRDPSVPKLSGLMHSILTMLTHDGPLAKPSKVNGKTPTGSGGLLLWPCKIILVLQR